MEHSSLRQIMGKLRGNIEGATLWLLTDGEVIDVACSLQGSEQAGDNRFNQPWQAGITTQPQFNLHAPDSAELLSLSKHRLALDYQYLPTSMLSEATQSTRRTY